MLYALNLNSDVCQLFLKTGKQVRIMHNNSFK